MPGNVNEPDPIFCHATPEGNTADTSGEFIRIFAAGALPEASAAAPVPADAGSRDDEFERLFTQAPRSVALPAKPPQQAASSDATLIFEALPPTLQDQRSPFAAPAAANGVSQTVAPSQPEQHPLSATQGQLPSRSSEFTQVFSQIAPPVGPALPMEAAPGPSTQSSGEFTQFFSAISAREAIAQQPVVSRPVPNQFPPSAGFADSRSDAVRLPVEGLHGRPLDAAYADLALPERGASSPSATANMLPLAGNSADALTQIFHRGNVSSEADRSVTAAVPARLPADAAGAFTQVFQQIAPPPRSDTAPQLASSKTVSSFPPPAPALSQGGSAFGPPPHPNGTFTDVFAAQPQAASTSRPPMHSRPISLPVQGSDFTELFHESPAPRPNSESSPFGNFNSSAQGVTPAWPTTPSSSQAVPSAIGGDFTRLMQSLTPDGQGAAPAPTVNDAFFSPAVGNAQLESEYTRVQRASSRREAGAAASPVAAPAAAQATGPTVPSIPEKAPGSEVPTKKSRKLVILLVAMNVLLLFALLVVGFLVLRRK